jgi:hypothetical protein
MDLLPTLNQITQAYQSCTTQEQLDQVYDQYLGKNGSITTVFKTM